MIADYALIPTGSLNLKICKSGYPNLIQRHGKEVWEREIRFNEFNLKNNHK
jgi:hypothetical protein